jgi:ketosteroid isomerase-like protein
MTGNSLELDVHDLLANDEHGVALVQFRAQRDGKRIDQKQAHVFHIGDGAITESWSFPDDTAESNSFFS